MSDLSQIPATVNITINQGDDFNRLVTIGIVGGIVGYTLECAVETINGLIPMTITPSDLSSGKFYISLTEIQTALIPPAGSRWYLKWTVTDQTRTAIEGDFLVI